METFTRRLTVARPESRRRRAGLRALAACAETLTVQPIETLEGIGEVSLKGGDKIGHRIYTIEVWHPEEDAGHLRGGGSVPTLKRYVVTIALSSAEIAQLAGRNALLTVKDGRRLPIMVNSDGTIEAMGGLPDKLHD